MDNNELQILILALINEAKSLIKMREQLKELGEKGLNIPVIAKLSKQKSRQQLKKDLETLDKLYLSVSGKLNRTKSRKNFKTDLKALEIETVKFDAEIDTAELEKTLSEIANRSTTVNVDTKVGDTNGLQTAGNAIDNIGRKSSTAAVSLAMLYKSILQLDRIMDRMINTAVELDKGLTNIRMTTGESYEDASRLVDSYNEMAKSIKSTTTQVIDSASEWLRQGKTLEETNELIRQSMILSKVGNMESATATQRLTSALNGYKLAASDASAVVDKLTAVDMEAAVSADGIAEALSHTASSASLAGVELDKIISYLTVVQETSQKSASVIGESFKSIFARMSKVTNGEAIDDFGEDISQVESNLRRLGIELRESATEFRDYDDVLDELGAKWKELTEGDRNQIATAFGGVYQRENFITLMNNYEKVAEYVDTAANSAGTAAEKFTAYQESVEAHYNTMIASAEALSKQTVPPELLNGFMDAAAAIMDFTAQTHLLEIALASLGSAGAVKGFTALTARIRETYDNLSKLTTAFTIMQRASNGSLSIDQFNDLLAVTKGLNAAQLKLIVSNKALTTEQRMAILTTNGLTTEQAAQTLSTMGLATAEGAATTATFSLTGAMQALKAAIASNPIGFLVVALTSAVSVISAVTSEVKQAQEEARQAIIDTGDAIYETANEIESAYVKFKKYNNIVDKTADDEANLNEAIDALNAILGDNATAFDTAATSAENYAVAIGNTVSDALHEAWVDAKKVSDAAMKDLAADTYSWVNGSQITVKVNPYTTDEQYSAARQIVLDSFDYDLDEKYYSAHGTSSYEYEVEPKDWDSNHDDMNAVVEYYYDLLDIQDKLAEQDLMQTDIYDSITAKINLLKDGVETYIQAKYNELKLEYEWQNGVPSTVDEYNNLIAALTNATGVGVEFQDQLRSMAHDDFYEDIHAGTQTIVNDTAALESATQTAVSNFRNTISTLKSALNEYNSTGSVTTDTYNKVLALGEDCADLFTFQNGKIEMLIDATSDYVDGVIEETGAILAANNATDSEINLLASLSSAFRETAEETEITTASLKSMVDLLSDSREGTEYSTLAMLDLIEQYPELIDGIIESANGYQIEESAVLELIAAKAELLKINESLAKQTARNTLIDNANNSKTADTVDDIFEKYYADTGKQIETFDDYVTAWESYFNRTASGSWVDGLEEYVEASIDEIKRIEAIDSLMSDLLNPENYKFGTTSTSRSSSAKEETEFERAYKLHQHYLKMDQESVEDYLTWLNSAYKAAYDAGQVELDDYYKYQEEVYEKTKSLFDDTLGDTEHQIMLITHQDGNMKEVVKLYEQLQQAVHEQADKYRAAGLDENNELIQDLQKQWWDYSDSIEDIYKQLHSDSIGDYAHDIFLKEQADADSQEIIDIYRKMQEETHAEADRARAAGADENADYIQELQKQWWDYQESIEEMLHDIYKTTVEEHENTINYLESQYDALDSNRSSAAMSENLNKQLEAQRAIQRAAAEEADRLRATGLDENDEAIQECIDSWWDAESAIRDINSQIADDALSVFDDFIEYADGFELWGDLDFTKVDYLKQKIAAINRLFEEGTLSLKEYNTLLRETQLEIYNEQKEALTEIIEMTMELVRQEAEDHVDALEDQIDAYKKIIDLKKKALSTSYDEENYEKEVAKRTAEIAEVQAKIAQLERDDSRKANAEKQTLAQELAELEAELADYQAQYSYDAQVDALDKEADAFEETKNNEISMVEDTVDTEEEVYAAAIARIDGDWEQLYNDLIAWNKQYGGMIDGENSIASAWQTAKAAAEEYGNVVSALDGISSNVAYEKEQARNQQYTDNAVHSIIKEMYANSQSYHTADGEGQKRLDARNLELGAMLAQYGITAVRGNDGVWYLDNIGGEKLYDKYKLYTYHTGGIVGDDPNLKNNEVLAKLEKGEAVYTQKQNDNLLDMIKRLSQLDNMVANLAKTTPAIDEIVKTITNNNGDTDNSTNEDHITINNEFHMEDVSEENMKQFADYYADHTIDRLLMASKRRGVKNTVGSHLLR